MIYRRNYFDLGYPIFLIERFVGYFELLLFFSSANNDEIINFYINNMDLLGNFGQFFKEKAVKLLQLTDENRIIIPEKMKPNFHGLHDLNASRPNKLALHKKNIRFSQQFGVSKTILTPRKLNVFIN